jgi:hypothetical protein
LGVYDSSLRDKKVVGVFVCVFVRRFSGVPRFDGAIQDLEAVKNDLTGNMPTEKLLSYFTANKENTNLNH